MDRDTLSFGLPFGLPFGLRMSRAFAQRGLFATFANAPAPQPTPATATIEADSISRFRSATCYPGAIVVVAAALYGKTRIGEADGPPEAKGP